MVSLIPVPCGTSSGREENAAANTTSGVNPSFDARSHKPDTISGCSGGSKSRLLIRSTRGTAGSTCRFPASLSSSSSVRCISTWRCSENRDWPSIITIIPSARQRNRNRSASLARRINSSVHSPGKSVSNKSKRRSYFAPYCSARCRKAGDLGSDSKVWSAHLTGSGRSGHLRSKRARFSNPGNVRLPAKR